MSEYSQAELVEKIAEAMRRREDWWREFEGIPDTDFTQEWSVPLSGDQLFRWLSWGFYFRSAPRRRYAYMQDGTEVSWPEPVREKLEKETPYYTPSTDDGFFSYYISYTWEKNPEDYTRLRMGRIHLTPDAAREHRDAEIILAGGTLPGGEDDS